MLNVREQAPEEPALDTTHLHLDHLPEPRLTIYGQPSRDATGRVQFDAIAVEPRRVRYLTTRH